MFERELILSVKDVLDRAREGGLMIATAESCTGGLIAAALTSVAGSSAVVDRGFVTYSNEAKIELLGIAAEMIDTFGAVSEAVARAMAESAVERSDAQISVAVTGIAGPGGGTEDKPVGLVHLAAASSFGATIHQRMTYGDIGRDEIRAATLEDALAMLRMQLGSGSSAVV